MALLFWDGLDFYSSLGTFVSMYPQHLFQTNQVSFNTSGGRFNGCNIYQGAEGDDSGTGYLKFPSGVAEFYCGKAIYAPAKPSASWLGYGRFHRVWNIDGGTVDLTVCLEQDCSITAWRGARVTLLAQTAPNIFTIGAWHFIETRVKLGTSDGVCEFWLDGGKVLSVTAANTKQSGLSADNLSRTIEVIGRSGIGFQGHYHDDMYFLDTTGSAPWNTRLGDIRIALVVPNTDVGANSGTPSTGTAHWAVVDETPLNTSDYITIPNVANNTERFYHSVLPSNAATIYAVAIETVLQKSDAGLCNVKPVFVSNGTNFMSNGNTKVLSTTWTAYRDEFPTNPETSAQWTATAFGNVQVGVVVT